MKWEKKDRIWVLKYNRLTFMIKRSGPLFWLSVQRKGEEPFAVFQELWGKDLVEVKAGLLRRIAEIKKGKDGTVQ